MMSEQILNIENLLIRLSEVNLREENHLEVLLKNPKEYPTELVEKLSIDTAIKYWQNDIDFQTGDRIMNRLYNFWACNKNYFENYIFSDISQDCFDAFDAGEYHHNGDDHNIDPIEKYTKPEIEKVLRKIKLIE